MAEVTLGQRSVNAAKVIYDVITNPESAGLGVDQMDEIITRAYAESGQDEYNRAIEHGRYLATAAETYLNEINRLAMAESGFSDEVPDVDALSDCHQALRVAIYEFRKRAERSHAGQEEG
jgi:hypothetical protein